MSWVTPEDFAAQVIRNVCELPDYNSPDDQPDLLQCTVRELEFCVVQAFEHFDSEAKDAADYHRKAANGFADERNRYRDALKRICDSKDVPWTAAAMFHIADAALKGSASAKETK